MNIVSTVLTLVTISAMALAGDVVGYWSGKVVFEVDKNSHAQLKGMVPKMPGLTLEIRANKTYKGTQSGGQDGKEHVAEGTWSLEGSTLKLMPLKRDGKAASGEGAKPRIYSVSKDGKSLTLDLSAQFKAAATSAGSGKTIPQFKAKMVLHRAK